MRDQQMNAQASASIIGITVIACLSLIGLGSLPFCMSLTAKPCTVRTCAAHIAQSICSAGSLCSEARANIKPLLREALF